MVYGKPSIRWSHESDAHVTAAFITLRRMDTIIGMSYGKYDGGLEIDPTSAAILFEGYTLIFVFEQIFLYSVYVGRLAVISFLLTLFYIDEIHPHDHY